MKKAVFVTVFMVISLSFSFLSAENSFLSQAFKRSPLKDKSENRVIHQLQDAYHDVYELYKDSVVYISTERTVKAKNFNPFMDDPMLREFFGYKGKSSPSVRKARGLGTGFVITADGYICTNNHVVKNVDKVKVTIAGKTYDAKIIGSDSFVDIALLKVKQKARFKPVYIGNSDKVKVGDFVAAIGNPFGLDKTYTTGVVSGRGRKKLDGLNNIHIQTDASINPGNSGGPLINIDGEVIGVNRAIYSKSGGSIGIGFAIPINVALDSLKQLKKYGKVKRGYIGVGPVIMTKAYARQLGLKKPQGVLIGRVLRAGPAAKAGIEVGDVILKIDEKPVNSAVDLISVITKKKIGSTVKVLVYRDKQKTNFWVTITERP